MATGVLKKLCEKNKNRPKTGWHGKGDWCVCVCVMIVWGHKCVQMWSRK